MSMACGSPAPGKPIAMTEVMRTSASALVVALSLTSGIAHAGGGAYQTARAAAAKKVKSAKAQLEAGRLKTSPQLSFTRDVIARPGSDWGIYGIGETFKEKRSALVNLRWAKQNLQAADGDLAAAHKATRWWSVLKRGSVKKARSEVAGKLKEVDQAREALRATAPIWRELGILTFDAKPEQRETLRAVIEDNPGDAPVVERHVDDYIRSMPR
jgi:hypothetical protein